MALVVTTDDLDSLLAMNGTIDTRRAALLLGLAQDLCSSVVSPVPDNARAIVYSIAARAYMNPAGVAGETVGPTSVQFGPGALGGLGMTKREVSALKRLAGVGGAFSVDPTPSDAGTELYPWDLNIWWLQGEDQALSMGADTTDPANIGMWF